MLIPPEPTLIITGGQSGADLTGNRFAERHKIPHLIRAFDGFKPIFRSDWPDFDRFPKEFVVSGHAPYKLKLVMRTSKNVQRADATLLFIEKPLEDTKGSQLTLRVCRQEKKPCALVELNKPDTWEQAAVFLAGHKPLTLNIAGQRDLFAAKMKHALETIWEKYVELYERPETAHIIHFVKESPDDV